MGMGAQKRERLTRKQALGDEPKRPSHSTGEFARTAQAGIAARCADVKSCPAIHFDFSLLKQ